MTEILDKVIIPFNTNNRISGDDFKYEPEAIEALEERKDPDGDK